MAPVAEGPALAGSRALMPDMLRGFSAGGFGGHGLVRGGKGAIRETDWIQEGADWIALNGIALGVTALKKTGNAGFYPRHRGRSGLARDSAWERPGLRSGSRPCGITGVVEPRGDASAWVKPRQRPAARLPGAGHVPILGRCGPKGRTYRSRFRPAGSRQPCRPHCLSGRPAAPQRGPSKLQGDHHGGCDW